MQIQSMAIMDDDILLFPVFFRESGEFRRLFLLFHRKNSRETRFKAVLYRLPEKPCHSSQPTDRPSVKVAFIRHLIAYFDFFSFFSFFGTGSPLALAMILSRQVIFAGASGFFAPFLPLYQPRI